MVLKLQTSESKISWEFMRKKNYCVESRRKGTSYTQLKKGGYRQRDSFLKHVIERKTEVTSKEKKKIYELSNNFKETRRCWKLKEEALYHNM